MIENLLTRWDVKLLLVSIGLLSLTCNCTHFGRQPYDKEEISVLFNYVDSQARKVCISGSFNQWSTHSHCMVKKGDAWSLELSLPRGRYPYLLVVDDAVMKPDPGAILVEESGFGMKNSILIVE
jgi:1,4-alpha-glucan branching enzyme